MPRPLADVHRLCGACEERLRERYGITFISSDWDQDHPLQHQHQDKARQRCLVKIGCHGLAHWLSISYAPLPDLRVSKYRKHLCDRFLFSTWDMGGDYNLGLLPTL